ncbi:MAG: M48 family metallopeptidase [Phycisphaerales bacterium]|nr:M48 family metallopeptidase [Phycisphaerales bacterium]
MSKPRPARPEPAPAPTEPGGGVARLSDAAEEVIRGEMRAYAGTSTYLELIRRNKRRSALLIVFMVLLAVGIGVVVGLLFGGFANPESVTMQPGPGIPEPSRMPLLLSAFTGGAIAFFVALAGAAWSWNSGAKAVLAIVGAKEVSRELDPELFNVVDEVRVAAGLPMPRVYLIPETALNAFATGRDPEHGVIAITSGLREKLARDELQGVVAHEMSHIRHLDIRFAMLMATMAGLIVLACDLFWRMVWHSRGFVGGRNSKEAGGRIVIWIILMVVSLVLAIVAPIITAIIQMAYSREREYLADAGAVELTRNPQGLANALRRLASDRDPHVDLANRGTAHMYIVNPLRKAMRSGHSIDSLFASHPPIHKRIARIEMLMR